MDLVIGGVSTFLENYYSKFCLVKWGVAWVITWYPNHKLFIALKLAVLSWCGIALFCSSISCSYS